MKLLRQFPALAFTLVLLSLLGVSTALRSLPLLMVAGVLAAVSWYITEGPRSRSLPKWAANVLVMAACLHVFFDLLTNRHDVVGVLARFSVWLTLIKLYEHKTARDYATLLALSLLLMLIGALASADLLFGVILLAYGGLGLYALLLFQLHRGFEDARKARGRVVPREYRLAPPLRPIFGRGAGGQFGSLSLVIALAGLGLSIGAFVLTPRGPGRGFMSDWGRDRSVSGFTSQVDLTSASRISQSRRVVMQARLRATDGGGPIRMETPLYLRGGVLTRWSPNGVWRPPDEVESRRLLVGDDAVGIGGFRADEAPTYELSVTMLEPASVVFAPYLPVRVAVPGGAELEYQPRTQLLSVDGRGALDVYRVSFQPTPSRDTLRQTTIMGPSPSRRNGGYDNLNVEQLARQLLEDARIGPSPPRGGEDYWRWSQSAARAFERFLRSDQFTYTLDLSTAPPLQAGMDPVESFLFEGRRGHCEYFASAMAALCHCVEIQARVVTGYLATEYDEGLSMYLVRDSNAHAWVEVRSSDEGWTNFDPTPAADGFDASLTERTLTDRLRWMYERMEFAWNTNVVSYNQSSQTRLATRFDFRWGERIGNLMTSAKDAAASLNRTFYFGYAGYLWLGLVGCILIAAILVLLRIALRRRRLRRMLHLSHLSQSAYRRMLRQLGFYLDMLGVLRRAGRMKPSWQPPLDFARTLRKEDDVAATLVAEVTDLFYAVRYGDHELSASESARATALVAELDQHFRERAA